MAKAIECAYTSEGSGPPLLLIHGIGAARDAWRFIVPHLYEQFSVITYDLRGHGASPLSELPFGLDELVADVEHLREKLGLDAMHVAGHSLGGMIGPAYALKYPDRVLSLGLFSTAAGRNDDDKTKVWNVVRAMEDRGIKNVLPTLTDRWFTDDFINQNPDLVDRRLKQVISTDPDVFLNVFRIYAGTEMMPWLQRVEHKTLIVTGEFDGGCSPRLNRLIHQAMPNSDLVIMDGLKHSILAEAGKELAAIYSEFLQKIS